MILKKIIFNFSLKFYRVGHVYFIIIIKNYVIIEVSLLYFVAIIYLFRINNAYIFYFNYLKSDI